MTTPKTMLTLFQDTAALIRRGWSRDQYSDFVDDRWCFCLVGAFNEATSINNPKRVWNEVHHTAWARLNKYVTNQTGFVEIIKYNGHPDRTKAEVVALLDGLIDEVGRELEQGGGA